MDHEARLDLARRFSKEAKSRFKDSVKNVILYGSVSRGDDRIDSDIDIIVVQKNDEPDLQRELSFLSFDLGLDEGEHLSVQTVRSSHMQKFKDYSFFTNIKRDGIVLG